MSINVLIKVGVGLNKSTLVRFLEVISISVLPFFASNLKAVMLAMADVNVMLLATEPTLASACEPGAANVSGVMALSAFSPKDACVADLEAVLLLFLQAVTNVLATSTIANNCVENVFIMVY